MKLIISEEIFSEAQIKSPSFSLDSSSTTITTSPFLIDEITSFISSNLFVFILRLHYLIV